MLGPTCSLLLTCLPTAVQMVMSSVCLHCGRMGETRLQTRTLPHVAEGEPVMVMAFRCLLCGFRRGQGVAVGAAVPAPFLQGMEGAAGMVQNVALGLLAAAGRTGCGERGQQRAVALLPAPADALTQ